MLESGQNQNRDLGAEIQRTYSRLEEVNAFISANSLEALEQEKLKYQQKFAPYLTLVTDIFHINSLPNYLNGQEKEQFQTLYQDVIEDPQSIQNVALSVEKTLQILDPRSEEILRKYYGLNETQSRFSVKEIAAKAINMESKSYGNLGISPERVRFLIKRSQRKILYSGQGDIYKFSELFKKIRDSNCIGI